MRAIAPRIPGAEEVTFAEEQLEYAPIVACYIRYADDTLHRLCRWTFTPEERARIAAGEDIYFGTIAEIPLMPHYLQVGPPSVVKT